MDANIDYYRIAKWVVLRYGVGIEDRLREDAVADCAVTAWRSHQTYDAKYGRQVITHIIDGTRRYLRTWQWRHGGGLRQARMPEVHLTTPELARSTYPDHTISVCIQDQLRHALKILPKREQHIVTLRYCEGYQYREIAKIYGISYQRVKQLCVRAIARIRHALEDQI